jgi:hypothetical protein
VSESLDISTHHTAQEHQTMPPHKTEHLLRPQRLQLDEAIEPWKRQILQHRDKTPHVVVLRGPDACER